jgi:hypothetical protein
MATQPNKQWFRYVTDGGINVAIQADQDWGVNAASGLTAFNATDVPFGPQTRTHHLRKAVYRDAVTFRTVVHPVGTAAALAALPATLQVFVPGNAAAVTYNLSQRRPEKLRIPGPSRNLTDHP